MPPSPCPNSRLRGSGIIPQRSLSHAAVGLPSCFKSGEYHLPSPGGTAPPPVVYPSLPFLFAGPGHGHPSPILLLLWHRPVFRSPSFPRGHFRLLHGSLPPLGENGEGARVRMEDGLRPRSLALPRSSTVIVLLVFFTLRCNNDSWLRGWLLRPPDATDVDLILHLIGHFFEVLGPHDIYFSSLRPLC